MIADPTDKTPQIGRHYANSDSYQDANQSGAPSAGMVFQDAASAMPSRWSAAVTWRASEMAKGLSSVRLGVRLTIKSAISTRSAGSPSDALVRCSILGVVGLGLGPFT